MLKKIFCKHKYIFMTNPRHSELRGIWINNVTGKVYNKKICLKCNKIKKILVTDKEKSE